MKQKKMLLFFWVMALAIQTQLMAQNIGIGHNVAEGLLDINGDIVLRSADITLADGTTLAVNVESNPYSNYRISGPTEAFTIAGIGHSPDGRMLSFYNHSGHNMSIIHESPEAEPAERIHSGSGFNISVPDKASISFTYDGTAQRWVVRSSSAPGPWAISDNRVFSTHTGNVGIGTQFPSYKLSVAGNGYFSGTNPNLALEPAQGSNYMNTAGLQIASPNTDNNPAGIQNNILAINGNQIQSYVRDIEDPLKSDLVRTLVINPLGGNVGIGTSTPASGAKTTIETADFSTALMLRNQSNSVRFEAFLGGAANGNTVSLGTPGDMPIAFYTNSANRLMIAANGNIGIGTSTDPDKKLHVQGSIKMTGAMYEPIRTIYGNDRTYDINPDDYNIHVAVPSNYNSIINFRLPNAAENTGRILKFSAESLPQIDIKYADFITIKSLSPTVQFENCTECPVLHDIYLVYPVNHPTFAIVERVTCITIQSDGIAWRLTNTNYFNFHMPN